ERTVGDHRGAVTYGHGGGSGRILQPATKHLETVGSELLVEGIHGGVDRGYVGVVVIDRLGVVVVDREQVLSHCFLSRGTVPLCHLHEWGARDSTGSVRARTALPPSAPQIEPWRVSKGDLARPGAICGADGVGGGVG